jgi:hypothetical protein
MARRTAQPYRNSLRPLLVTNSIIAGVIIAGIGIAYAWLGWKKQQRADQMRETSEAIARLERQHQALQVQMDESLADAPLRQRVESMGLGLQDIGERSALLTVRGTSPETWQLVKHDEK